MIRGIALVWAALGLVTADRSAATLRGNVRDCDGPVEIHLSGISVAAFNPARNGELMGILDAMSSEVLVVTDSAAMNQFNARQAKLLSLVRGPGAIARARTNANGDFTLAVPRADSVLIFAYRNLEDEPNYFTYRKVGGASRGTVYLDMSRGACRYQ
jgi:hypothetical protein